MLACVFTDVRLCARVPNSSMDVARCVGKSIHRHAAPRRREATTGQKEGKYTQSQNPRKLLCTRPWHSAVCPRMQCACSLWTLHQGSSNKRHHHHHRGHKHPHGSASVPKHTHSLALSFHCILSGPPSALHVACTSSLRLPFAFGNRFVSVSCWRRQ